MQPPFISDCFGRAVWDLGYQIHLDEGFLHAALPAAIPPGVAVSKDTPLSRGMWSVTSPEVVVRFRS